MAATPGRWAAVKRLWKPGDRITIALPMSLRTVRVDRQHPDRVAVMYGPVVLAQDEACCRRALAMGRATRLSSRLVQDGPGLRFRLINAVPERHTRHLVPLYDLPAFWPYWIPSLGCGGQEGRSRTTRCSVCCVQGARQMLDRRSEPNLHRLVAIGTAMAAEK